MWGCARKVPHERKNIERYITKLIKENLAAFEPKHDFSRYPAGAGSDVENHGPGSERLIGVNETLNFRIFLRMDQARGKRLPTRTKKSPVSAARRTLRSRTCTSEMSRLSVSYRS